MSRSIGVICGLDRYEARDDVEGALTTLTPDVTHDIVGWPSGPSRDRDGARSFYEAMFADLSDGRVQSNWRLYGDNFLVDESVWQGKAPGRPFGCDGKGRDLKFRLLHVLELQEETHGPIAERQIWRFRPRTP